MSTKRTLIEIIATGPQQVPDIARLGGDRIELCDKMNLGGTTPPLDWVTQIRNFPERDQLPLMVMIRPRGGNFTYSRAEFNKMLDSAEAFLKLGVAGLVFGILSADSTVDSQRTSMFIHTARKLALERGKPVELVFHRAFDEVPDPMSAASELQQLGVDRILTSGHEPFAEQGFQLIEQLVSDYPGLEILPGSGINAVNARFIISKTGATQIHSSCQVNGQLSLELLRLLVKAVRN